MIGGGLDFDLEFLRDAPGNFAERRRTSILSGTGEVDVLEDEGFGYTRRLDAKFGTPSGGRGLGLRRRSRRRGQGRESIVGASVEFLLRLTGSRRSDGNRTRVPRQTGERIRGTLEFVLLLFACAKKSRVKYRIRKHSQNIRHPRGVHANRQVTDLKLSGGQWHLSLIQTKKPAGVEYTGVRVAMRPVTGKPGEGRQSSEW